MPGNVAYGVRLCLEEAVANLIIHAPAASDIVVDLGWQGDVMAAAVEDQGPAFDPRTAPPPVRPVAWRKPCPAALGLC